MAARAHPPRAQRTPSRQRDAPHQAWSDSMFFMMTAVTRRPDRGLHRAPRFAAKPSASVTSLSLTAATPD